MTNLIEINSELDEETGCLTLRASGSDICMVNLSNMIEHKISPKDLATAITTSIHGLLEMYDKGLGVYEKKVSVYD